MEKTGKAFLKTIHQRRDLDFRLHYFDYSHSGLQLLVIFIFEVDFSETYLMASENSVSEPPNLKIFPISSIRRYVYAHVC